MVNKDTTKEITIKYGENEGDIRIISTVKRETTDPVSGQVVLSSTTKREYTPEQYEYENPESMQVINAVFTPKIRKAHAKQKEFNKLEIAKVIAQKSGKKQSLITKAINTIKRIP